MTQKGTACCLDRFGASTGLVALDGCYGEQYFVASPETVRSRATCKGR